MNKYYISDDLVTAAVTDEKMMNSLDLRSMMEDLKIQKILQKIVTPSVTKISMRMCIWKEKIYVKILNLSV